MAISTAQESRTGYTVGGIRMDRPFRVRRLGHFGFNYKDAKAALHFYADLLGIAVSDEEDFAKQSRLTLLGRGTSPAEISAAAKFILSQPALTGQMIVLDGGQHLVWQTPDVVEVNE